MKIETNVPEVLKEIVRKAVTDMAAAISALPGMADDGCVLELRPEMSNDAFLNAIGGIAAALRDCSFASNDPDGYGGGVQSLELGSEFLGGLVDDIPVKDREYLDYFGNLVGEDLEKVYNVFSDSLG